MEGSILARQPEEYVEKYNLIKYTAPCKNQMFDQLEALNEEFEYKEELYRQKVENFTNDKLMAIPTYSKLMKRLVSFNKNYNH